jgi:glycosyltransferase involved in cell wall biosynthesis
MKKICILVPSLAGGGAEKVAVNLANFYADMGFHVDLVVFMFRGQYLDLVQSDVHVCNLNVSRTRYAIPGIARYLRRNKPDYLISAIRDSNIFVGLSLMVTPSFNGRVVFREANTLHGMQLFSWYRRLLFRGLMKLCYRKANFIIANSHDTRQALIESSIANSDKVLVIPNPVVPNNVSALALEEIIEPWFQESGLKIVLGVGRLHEQKNFGLLIQAFSFVYKKVNEARLVIIGEGQEEATLRRQIEALGLEGVAKILPFKKNVYPYFKNAAVFVLTSKWEGFGNVLVDALAVGTPVVSADCPGGPRMILDGGRYGCLVPDLDPSSFSKAILEVLSKPDQVADNRADCIERSKLYSIPEVSRQYLAVVSGA